MSRYLRDFVVHEELGSGRYGRVWRAEGDIATRPGQPLRRRQVAIKVLRSDTPPAALAALEREWRLLDQVKHRAIVRVFAWWPDERAVVMEYVHGVTLRAVIDETRAKKEQIFTEAAIDIVCELGDALYQANTTLGDNGEPLHIVHRDLKPENIILTPNGDLRILDFGLARSRNADFAEDNDGLVRGTPVYMAPEQIRGEAVEHRTDLFALGLIFFELLTGRPAWSLPPGASPADVKALYSRIAKGDLTAECQELESTLPGTGTIVVRLLQANPRSRYANGQDLLVDLRRQLYRDRGASLKEFCDFFFGTVHPLPDPTVDPGPPMPSPPPPPIASPGGGAPSEPAAGDLPRAVPVRRAGRGVPIAAPSTAPVAPADVASRSAPRIIQRPTPQRPEAEDLPPSVRNNTSAGPRPKVVGSRSPDETGMLQVTPISGSPEAPRAGADPSATAFFAIAAPKGSRPKAAEGPGAFVPPPVASARAPSPPQGGAGVAGYGGAANGPAGSPSNPFPVTETVRSTSSAAETRVQSQRVWAVVLGVMFLGGMAVLLVLGIILWNQFHQPTPTTPPIVQAPIVAAPEPAAVEPDPDPVVKPTGRPTTGTKRTTPATTTTSAPTAAPVAATGTLSVTFTGSPLPSTATLRCGDEGSFGRPAVSGGRVSFANVPTNGDCTLTPSSAFTYSAFRHLHGGRSYSCDVTNFQTNCS